MNSIPCSVCGEGGHKLTMCPTLYSPLKGGFHQSPAGHQHSGDDEDEKLKQVCAWNLSNTKVCQRINSTLAILSPIRQSTWKATVVVMA